MVSDSDLVTRLHEILRETDLDTATAGSVRKQLEEGFGVDLSDRKAFVRDQIDIFLQNLKNDQEQEVEESDNGEQIARLEDDETAAVKEEEENASLEEEEEESNEEENEEESGANKVGKEVKRRRGGFHMLCSLSPQLQKIVGASALPRTEVVKKIWAYIRGKKLQDPKNRRNIICDESLHAVFRVKTINMFRMNKDLSKHIWPLSSEDDLDNQGGGGGGGGGEEEEEEEEEKEKEEEEKEEEEEREEEEDQEEEEEEVEEDEEKEQEEEGKEEEGEDQEGEEEGNPEGSKSEGSSKIGINVKKKGGGFTKLCSLSPQLQTFIGEPELARTEVVKRLWAYIREKNLQDPKNKRKIICDEELQALFRVKSINMFQMNKALSRHIWPLSEQDAPANSGKMKGQTKQARKQSLHEPQQKKRQKTGGSGFLAPLPLSDALVKFFGTGENALSRGAVVKRMWDYIKQNDLQDPSNRRRILCDDKLKELFDVESFDGFSVSKLLAAHFIKT